MTSAISFPSTQAEERPVATGLGAVAFERSQAPVVERTIKLCLAEEQPILGAAYQSFFRDHPTIQLAGSSDDMSTDFLAAMVGALEPDVLILGVKAVNAATVDALKTLRGACEGMGVVLLFAFYDIQGIKALRVLSRESSRGCAYLFKHTVDTLEQLTQVVRSVAEGRIIVDPTVMEELIRNGDAQGGFLSELSPRELEVLSWIAKGYRNETIANVLGRDVKTVERHINNIYGKLQATEDSDSRDRRVGAALTYLRATGALSSYDVSRMSAVSI